MRAEPESLTFKAVRGGRQDCGPGAGGRREDPAPDTGQDGDVWDGDCGHEDDPRRTGGRAHWCWSNASMRRPPDHAAFTARWPATMLSRPPGGSSGTATCALKARGPEPVSRPETLVPVSSTAGGRSLGPDPMRQRRPRSAAAAAPIRARLPQPGLPAGSPAQRNRPRPPTC